MAFTWKPKSWKAYDAAKVREGNIYLWLANIKEWWKPSARISGRGAQMKYSHQAIELCLKIKSLFRFTNRKTEGFITGLLSGLGISYSSPDHTTLSKRAKKHQVIYRQSGPNEDLHIAVDSSGLTIHSGYQWRPENYNSKRILGLSCILG